MITRGSPADRDRLRVTQRKQEVAIIGSAQDSPSGNARGVSSASDVVGGFVRERSLNWSQSKPQNSRITCPAEDRLRGRRHGWVKNVRG